MQAETQIVYTDIQTNRIARITDYYPMITPAELEELTWQTAQYKMIPGPAYQNPNDWEVTVSGTFKRILSVCTDEERVRLDQISLRASCLENISRVVNVIRFRKTKHIYAYTSITPMYEEEIKAYRETGVIGRLLNSLVDDIDELPIAIAEFELSIIEYNDFLKSSEVMRNKWFRQIKQAEDPISALNSIKRTLGI
jgi:hypothetical protein